MCQTDDDDAECNGGWSTIYKLKKKLITGQKFCDKSLSM